MQFAYCNNMSVQDATLILLSDINKHLDKPKSQIRSLYIDFSSAFNTMQPHVLLNKMLELDVNRNIFKWIFSFLTQRPQYTNVNNIKSNVIVTNTGAPQGYSEVTLKKKPDGGKLRRFKSVGTRAS